MRGDRTRRVKGSFRVSLTRKTSAPARARTLDPRIKSPLLYQLSYRGEVTARATNVKSWPWKARCARLHDRCVTRGVQGHRYSCPYADITQDQQQPVRPIPPRTPLTPPLSPALPGRGIRRKSLRLWLVRLRRGSKSGCFGAAASHTPARAGGSGIGGEASCDGLAKLACCFGLAGVLVNRRWPKSLGICGDRGFGARVAIFFFRGREAAKGAWPEAAPCHHRRSVNHLQKRSRFWKGG